MDENKPNEKYTFKIIIVGDASVGKTNITYRFCKGEFINEYQATLGLDYLSENRTVDNTFFKLQLWDTAGSERYRSISKTYYKNSACALVVYDITRKSSFDNVSGWIEDCKQSGKNIYIILIGNKDDLSAREVSNEEGRELAEKYDVKFYETSAVNGHNIEEVFIDACKAINNKIKKGEIDLDDISCGVKKLDERDNQNTPSVKLDNSDQSDGKNNKTHKKKFRC